MSNNRQKGRINWVVGFHPAPFILLLGILSFAIVVCIDSGGQFVYSTDHALVYLTMAERLASGEWLPIFVAGLSLDTGALWPILLLPLIGTSYAILMPLLLNTLFAILTLVMFQWLFSSSVVSLNRRWQRILSATVGVAFLMSSHFFVFIVAGVEQMMLIASCAWVFWGLIRHQATDHIFLPWMCFVGFLPFVHLSAVVLLLGVVVYFFARGLWREACALMLISGAVFVSAVAVVYGVSPDFLTNNPLSWTSVIRHSGVLQDGWLHSFEHMHYRDWSIIGVAALSLLSLPLPIGSPLRALCFSFCCIAIGCCLIGSDRYSKVFDPWVWVVAIMMLLVIVPKWFVVIKKARWSFWILVPVLMGAFWTPGFYQQVGAALDDVKFQYLTHYQVRRFVTRYYREPVAVSSGGWVSWRNENYVLDVDSVMNDFHLVGKGGRDVCSLVNALTGKHLVQLVVLDHQRFGSAQRLPSDWHHVATLVPLDYSDSIYFYVTNPAMDNHVRYALRKFQRTLPQDAALTIHSVSKPLGQRKC